MPLTFPRALIFVFALLAVPMLLLAQEQPKLSAPAQRQAEALQTEKQARTRAQQKLDSQLIYRIKKHRGEKLGPGLEAMEERIKLPEDGRETVDIQGEVTPELLAELKAAGAEIVAAVPRFKSVRAKVPLGKLEAVAGRDDVKSIKPAVRAMTHAGGATSQGDVTHRANLLRSTLQASGRGIRIGVLSDSVDHLLASQTSGDLGPVTVLPGQSGLGMGNSGEGTAMLEIVHDLAPDAELFFASAFISEAQFAQNILDLRTAGCDIIVDDVGYFDESPFQDGPVAQAVDQVAASGALYFSAAGNEGSQDAGTSGVWEGDFSDGGPTGAIFNKAGRLHSFGPQAYNTVNVNGAAATLFWSDPAGASSNDYDLYLLDSTGTQILAASTNTQNGTQDPYEIVPTAAGTRLVIVKSIGAQPRHLHLNTLRGTVQFSTAGAIQGHPGAEGALAVAAVDANTSFPNIFTAANVTESFSTDGNRRVFFYADGTPITAGNLLGTGGTVRAKPDLAAADGVTTSVLGFAPFYGTSAAAPHAGAIAALVWSRNRTLTPAQVRAALASTTLDIGTAGLDRLAGAGLVDALAAAQAVSGGVILQPGAVIITGESFTPANGFLDPGETVTVSLPLQNLGPVAATNVQAVLQNTGPVSNATSANYGALAIGGSAARSFSFQVNGAVGSSIPLTFQLFDGATFLGAVTVPFTIGSLGATQTFSNAAAITIPSAGSATPYPSTINVTGVTGQVGKVTVTLTGFTHTYPSDVDVLLVSPSGRRVILLSDAGGDTPVSILTFTLDDAAEASIPEVMVSGTYKPTPAGTTSLTTSLNAPAPAQPYAGTLSAFQGDTPNGNWQLYVRDQFLGDSGSFSGGWTLRITPAAVPANNGANPDLKPVLQQSVTQLSVGEAVIYTATVYNNGPAAANAVVLTDDLPAGLTYGSATVSQGTVSFGGVRVTANLGAILSRQSATVSIVATGAAAGSFTNTVNVSLTGTENTTANNAASAALSIGVPNLLPSTAVVSTATGTNIEAATISPADSLFLDLGYTNSGSSAAHSYFKTELYIDGALRRTFEKQLPLSPGAADQFLDIPLGSFSPGSHTVQVKIDAGANVSESNETDNVFTRTFFVQGPNLTTFKPAGWSDRIVVSTAAGTNLDSPSYDTRESLFLDAAIANTGGAAAGTAFTSELYVDGVLRTTRTTSGPFNAGAQDLLQDFPLGQLPAGTHTIRLVIDAAAAIGETDETDNAYTKTIVVNAPPTISSIDAVSLDEDGSSGALSFTIGDSETAAANLTLSATTANALLVPLENIVFSGSGAARTVTVTPAANLSGSATIGITVADASGSQTNLSFAVTVTALNDAPSFLKGTEIAVNEDAGPQSLAAWARNIAAGPADESGQALEFSVGNDNPTLFAIQPSVSADGTLSFTAAPDAFGSALVTVALRDNGGTANGGSDTSAAQTFTIQVLPVNDAPTLNAITAVQVLESATTATSDVPLAGIGAGAANEAQPLQITATTDNPTLLTSLAVVYQPGDSTGTLQITRAAQRSGTANVTVTVNDGTGQNATASQTFAVTVLAVNDQPSFTKGGDVTVDEDAGPQSFNAWATSMSAGAPEEAGQTLVFTVSNDAPGLFSSAPTISADGMLSFTPAPDQNGAAHLTVTMRDNGGTENGGVDTTAAQSFTITVRPVNDAPTFVKGADINVARDAGPQRTPAWATRLSPGPPDESQQTVHFLVSADHPEFFAVPPAIDADGTLRFSPAPQASGAAVLTVRLQDDGGGNAPDADTSAPQTFVLRVTTLEGATGAYHGLVQAPPGTPAEHARAGLVDLKIGKSGVFTGRLILEGRAHLLRGAFDNAGIARFGVAASPAFILRRAGKPQLELALQVDVANDTNKLTGTLTAGGQPFAVVNGDRALFTSAAPVSPLQNVPAWMDGSYTLVFAARTPAEQGRPASEYPQGHGIGRLTVGSAGVARLTARLADGTRISYANSLSVAGDWPFLWHSPAAPARSAGRSLSATAPARAISMGSA